MNTERISRKTTRIFPGTPEQAREARRWLDAQLTGCPDAADVILCATELVNNAVRHSASGRKGGNFHVNLQISDTAIRVEVVDQGSNIKPHLTDAGMDAEHGRGLQLVDALASRWGITGNHTSWTVWLEMDRESDTLSPPHEAA